MAAFRALALGVRFVLELGALAALAYWGFGASADTLGRILLGVGAPLGAAALWGAFVAPKRAFETAPSVRLAVEALVFGAATVALWASGRPTLALILAAAAVLDRVALRLAGERGAPAA